MLIDGWNLKENINTDNTKYMLSSYNKNAIFAIIKVDNNKINEISVAKFLSIHLDKNNCKSYNLNIYVSFVVIPETIFLKRCTLHLFTHTYHMVWKHVMEHIKIIPLKSPLSRKMQYVQ